MRVRGSAAEHAEHEHVAAAPLVAAELALGHLERYCVVSVGELVPCTEFVVCGEVPIVPPPANAGRAIQTSGLR